MAPGATLPGGSSATSNGVTDVNNAQPPTIPEPDKAVCIFRSNIGKCFVFFHLFFFFFPLHNNFTKYVFFFNMYMSCTDFIDE